MKVELYLDETHHVLNLRTKNMLNVATIKLTAQAEALLKRAIKATSNQEDADCFLIATGTEFTTFGTKEYGEL